MQIPSNALGTPIEELIKRLQGLPPGTTYEEHECEFYGGETPGSTLGTGYKLVFSIVEGFNPPRK